MTPVMANTQESDSSLKGDSRRASSRPITFAYSGDPDDALAFFGLVSEAVKLSSGRPRRFLSSKIQDLNERAIRGEYEVSAISSAAYPLMHEKYFISSAGSSVGRGYGPLFASKRYSTMDELRGKRVASPGPLTTGNLLLRMTHLDCEFVYLPFDRIREAILSDEVDAGVLIHEELLNYKEVGLKKIDCLGRMWHEMTGLPLPVGLNVVRRDLGRAYAGKIVDLLRQSILYGLEHREEAFHFACKYSIALRDGIADDFVDKFTNQDTVNMDDPTRQALRILLDFACEIHSVPRIESVDIL